MTYDQLQDRLVIWISGRTDEDFERLVLEIHTFQRAANPAYGAWCLKSPQADSWKTIPALPQSVFKREEIRCFPKTETVQTFRTSGTTGEGYGEHHFGSLAIYREAALAGWQRSVSDHLEVISLIPPVSDLPHSSLSHMASWLASAENFHFHGGQIDWRGLESNLSQRTRPFVLFGTALAYLDWFEHLDDRSIRLPPECLAVETGGYKGTNRSLPKEALYERFGRHLGLGSDSIINEYGMTELSSQFYSRGIGRPHKSPPWARALVVEPESGREVEDGQTGVLRLIDAANLGSCCAIQTRDLAVRHGDDFLLLGRDPAALPRGCSRSADETLSQAESFQLP